MKKYCLVSHGKRTKSIKSANFPNLRRLVVFENHDEIVGLSLSCGQCVQDSRKWSLSIEVELKLMSSSEKGFSKVRRLLVKTLTKIELQLLDTEDLIENFVSAESVRIQVDVKILEQKGM